MKFRPKPNQLEAIRHGIQRPIRAWFIEMGLGKTAACLAVWEHMFAEGVLKGVLVVAPLRVATLTWPNEVEKWEDFRWMRVANLRTKEGMKAWEDGTAEIYCINYEMLAKFAAAYIKGTPTKQLPVNEVFFDEIDNAKGHGSKRINEFRRLTRRKFGGKVQRIFPRWGGMTGTPIANDRTDIFAQIRLLDDGERYGTAFTSWRETHFEVVNPFSDWPKFRIREGHKEILEEQIADIALVQRARDHQDWDPPQFEEIECSLPSKAFATYQTLEKELLAELDNGAEVAAVTAGVLAGKLLQMAGGAVYTQEHEDAPKEVQGVHDAKIEAAIQFQRDNPGEPLLVGYWFQHERDRLLKALDGAEVFTEDKLVAWNRGDIPVLLGHPKSMGHGLNMQDGGKTVLWFTRPWSPRLFDQYNARLARRGQCHTVRVVSLVCPSTIDVAVGEALRSKGDDQNAFMQTLQNLQRMHL